MKVLMIAEHDNKTLKSVNSHTLSAAIELGKEIDLLIAGYQCQTVVDEAKKLDHFHKILLADARDYEHQLAENMAALIADHAKKIRLRRDGRYYLWKKYTA